MIHSAFPEDEAGARSRSSSAPAWGTFVCVIGPSGAGKDSLIGLAKEKLMKNPAYVFPRRLITRPKSSFEDHDTLREAAFEQGIQNGLFALHWRAHGLGYAIDCSIMKVLARGRSVICNVSRASLPLARKVFVRLKVVLVTAPVDVLAARLAARGREDPDEVAARIARNDLSFGEIVPDLTIINTSTLEQGVDEVICFLHALAANE